MILVLVPGASPGTPTRVVAGHPCLAFGKRVSVTVWGRAGKERRLAPRRGCRKESGCRVMLGLGSLECLGSQWKLQECWFVWTSQRPLPPPFPRGSPSPAGGRDIPVPLCSWGWVCSQSCGWDAGLQSGCGRGEGLGQPEWEAPSQRSRRLLSEGTGPVPLRALGEGGETSGKPRTDGGIHGKFVLI